MKSSEEPQSGEMFIAQRELWTIFSELEESRSIEIPPTRKRPKLFGFAGYKHFAPTALLLILSLLPIQAMAQRKKTHVDLIIKGGTIVTMDGSRRVIDNGGVAVKGGRIVAVGRAAEIDRNYAAREVINATDKVVIPGLINGHTHVPMTLFRGIADDLDLQDWLTKYIFPAEAKNVTEDFVRAGTRLGLAEMIRGGTTTYCDMYYFEDAIADETFKAGVRGVLGETVIDFPVADNKTYEEGLAYVERFVKKWKGHELVVPAIAPHAPYTVSEAHLKAVRAFSDRTEIGRASCRERV